MKNLILIGLLLPACLLLVHCSPKVETSDMGNKEVATAIGDDAPEIEKVVYLANKFQSLLTEEQQQTLQQSYSKTNAGKWSNFPQPAHPIRVGIGFGELDSLQLVAAKELLTFVLDEEILNEGFDEVEGILAADDLLHTVPNKARIFGSDNYFLAFLGEPSTTGLWELQFGGHHLAVANTYNDGKLVGMTPSFRGVEPMSLIEANDRHYQPMEQEKLAFVSILRALSEEELQRAKLSASFSDILLGPGKDNVFPDSKEGLKVGELSEEKQKLVLEAIALYVKDIRSNQADEILTAYAAAIDDTYLAYSGSATMEAVGDYIRIDGPRVWIEYNAQPSRDIKDPPIHPHSIWRDRKSDYGGQ